MLGRYNARLFMGVFNLLNTDDLTIFTFEPQNSNSGGQLQLNAQRDFGRRFEIGFQIEF